MIIGGPVGKEAGGAPEASSGALRPLLQFAAGHERRAVRAPATTRLSDALKTASNVQKQALADAYIRVLAQDDFVHLIIAGHPLLTRLEEMGVTRKEIFKRIIQENGSKPTSETARTLRRTA